MKEIKTYFLFTIVWIVLCSTGYSQESEVLFKQPWQIKKQGKNAARYGDSYSAIDCYLKYLEYRPGKHKISFELAELYRSTRYYTEAKKWYKKTYDMAPEKYPEALFYNAVMLKRLAVFDSSETAFLKFKKSIKGHIREKYYKKLVSAELQGLEMAKQVGDSIDKAIVTHLDTSINHAHTELSPYFLDDSTIIYSSLKSDSVPYYFLSDSTTKKPVKQFYKASKKDGKWYSTGLLEGPFNKPNEHVGNGSYSPDGKRFYFTRCKKNWQNKMICAIYKSELENGDWSEPEALGINVNDPKYSYSMPTVGTESKKNRETIYFVSDRPGGKGGKDLWYTYYEERKKAYRVPKNLGSKINTVGDELTPFYNQDTKTLYFSTDGRPGLGGLDIFKSFGELSKFSLPENIGHPINSGADELYYTLSNNKDEGLFVFNRDGSVVLKHNTCCDDIFAFKYINYIHLAVEGTLKTTDSLTGKQLPINDAVVSLVMVTEDGEEIVVNKTNSIDGLFNLKLEHGNNYKVLIEKSGFFTQHFDLSTENMSASDTIQQGDVYMNKVPVGSIIIPNIYFDFDSDVLTKTSKSVLDTTILELLVDNPLIIVEISTHTDSKGSDKYNLSLSQKRAESVTKYLVSQGIAKKRLKSKGYGELKPIAPNENEDGTDNPEGREKNRRCEFEVIGKLEVELEEEEE